MKDKIKKMQDVKTWYGEIPMWYRYTYGIAGERFFREIEKGKLIGSKCPSCGNIYIPPKIYCEECFKEIDEYVPISLRGEIHSYTLLYEDLDEKRLDEPIIVAFITFPGAHGGIIHKLGEVDPQDIYTGMSVEPVFKKKEEREGSLRDILYFKPVEG
jgi:hypothetical protein